MVPAHQAAPGEGGRRATSGQLGLAYYLPQVIHEDRTPQGRKTRSVIPLFTSYLFLLGDDARAARRAQGEPAGQRPRREPTRRRLEHDLRQIHQMLASGLAGRPEPSVPVGARVRIMTGPLTGIEGTVIRRGKRDQFVAVVHFLGRGATVDLEDWQVEQVSETS